jgi:hypothetical protein
MINLASIEIPDYVEGVDFRQLHPTQEGARRWRFTGLHKLRLRQKGLVEGNSVIRFYDKHGKMWLQADQHGWLIVEGYSHNGCTPKRWVWPFGWMGTPDFPCGRENTAVVLASAFHDAHYQFHACANMPLNRSDADAIFRQIMILGGAEEVADIYFKAVQKFGSWSGRATDGEHSQYQYSP